jgi:hypothetical protein
MLQAVGFSERSPRMLAQTINKWLEGNPNIRVRHMQYAVTTHTERRGDTAYPCSQDTVVVHTYSALLLYETGEGE